MLIRQGEADVMDRVHEVCWDTEQNEIALPGQATRFAPSDAPRRTSDRRP